MKLKHLQIMTIGISLLLASTISVADDFGGMFDQTDKDTQNDDNSPDGEDNKDDSTEEKPDESGDKNKDTEKVSTNNLDSSVRNTEKQGRLQPFFGLGYAPPIMDMTEKGMLFHTDRTDASASGALPIAFGADFTAIDKLTVGLRFLLVPAFVHSEDDPQTFIFNLNILAGYYIFEGLKAHLGLGFAKHKLLDKPNLSLPLGVSYTHYLTDVGKGAFGLEFGIELNFSMGSELKTEYNSEPGTLANKLFMYPFLYVSARFSLPVL